MGDGDQFSQDGLFFDKTSVNYGTVERGSTSVQEIIMYNRGSQDVIVDYWQGFKDFNSLTEEDPDECTRGFDPECDPRLGCELGCGIPPLIISCGWAQKNIIPAYGSVTCTMEFTPLSKGKYNYEWNIYAPSEKQYWTIVDIMGEAV